MGERGSAERGSAERGLSARPECAAVGLAGRCSVVRRARKSGDTHRYGQSITADGITLTTFAREHVDPLFKQAGARKMGRRYEFINAAGDISLFALYSRGYGGGQVGFDAGWRISPRSGFLFREWMLRDLGKDNPPVTHLQYRLWSSGLTPPPEVQEIGHWGFHDASSAGRCGELLGAAISTTVIALLTRSLDRR